MMASIPNMRSTLLPVPAGKTGTAETAPGDFAAQLPIAQGKTLPAATPQPEPQPGPDGVALVVPDIARAIAAVQGEAPETETDAPPDGETAKRRPPQPEAVVIPFLQTVPAVPAQQPAVANGETPAAQPQASVVQAAAGKRGDPACGPGGKADSPLPAKTGAPEAKAEPASAEAPQVETPQVEAMVKELLRKQVAAKPAEPAKEAKAETARPEAAPVEAKAQVQVQAPAAPGAPAAVQTSVTVPALTPADQVQPALSPASAQPAPMRGEAAGTAGTVRSTDLAVERQLDLARESEWLDRLARDIARAGSSDTPLRFRLHPQTLGHLQVELQQGDRGTAIRLTVETEAARQLLADAQPRLAAEARAQGVRIAETHVEMSSSGRHAPGDQRRHDDTRNSPMIRTARGADVDAVASTRSTRRARLDRYA